MARIASAKLEGAHQLKGRGFSFAPWPRTHKRKRARKCGCPSSALKGKDYGTPELRAYKHVLAGRGNSFTHTTLAIDLLYTWGYLSAKEHNAAFHYRLMWQRVMRLLKAPKMVHITLDRLNQRGQWQSTLSIQEEIGLLERWKDLQDWLRVYGREKAELVNDVVLYDQLKGNVLVGKITVLRELLGSLEEQIYKSIKK